MKLLEVVKACNGKLIYGDENITCKNFSKDTRTINQNDVYVGIKGENFDGNTLYKDALSKGAKVCILQGINTEDIKEVQKEYPETGVILVEDTIKALQQIASYKRSLYNIPVIAITGSVGKTSTKDIVASVVSTKYKVHKTQGNLNNHIGVPLTILQLEDHQALVVEMGMNNLGEISVLSKIAKPNIAIITNVGTAHIGNLGSRENIRKAKLEILDGLEENGTLIINNDNDMLHDWYENDANSSKNILTYGIDNKSNIMAKDIELLSDGSKFNVNVNEISTQVEVPIGGLHFVYNALCAITVGNLINIEMKDIISGIKNFELSKNRMELIELKNGATLINDCYNANFDSMKAGIEYLSKTARNRKIAVLGDMLELGDFSKELHEKVGTEVVKNNIDILITVGNCAKFIADSVVNQNARIEIFSYDNNNLAIDKLKEIIKNDDTILIKASNGMHFIEIVEALKKY